MPPVGGELPVKKEQHREGQQSNWILYFLPNSASAACMRSFSIREGMPLRAALALGVGALLSPLLLPDAAALLPSAILLQEQNSQASSLIPFLWQQPETQKKDRVKM